MGKPVVTVTRSDDAARALGGDVPEPQVSQEPATHPADEADPIHRAPVRRQAKSRAVQRLSPQAGPTRVVVAAEPRETGDTARSQSRAACRKWHEVRRRLTPLGFWVVLPLLLGACAGTSGAVSQPSAVSLVVTLHSSDILTGDSTSALAFAQFANGSSGVVDATWSSDRPSVATVTRSGVVMGAGGGTATILAAYQGLTGSATVTVRPNFAGTWSGTAAFVSCRGFPDPRTCGYYYPLNSTPSLRVDFTQQDNSVGATFQLIWDAYQVTGMRLNGKVTGTFDSSGVLNASNTSLSNGPLYPEFKAQIADGVMSGTFTLYVPAERETWGAPGTVIWNIVALTKQ